MGLWTIWVFIPPSSVNRLHVHRRWWRLLNRLIWVSAERTDAFTAAALATAACVHTATQNGKNENKATYEDVRPIACRQTLKVLLLLGSRNGGMHLLRSREESIRGRARRVCTVQTDLDKVSERAGTVG